MRRDDRQMRKAPFALLRFEFLRALQLEQMADRRRQHVLIALVVIVMLLETAQRLGDAGSSSDSNRIQQADGSVARPYFELQRSFDLWRWQPIGERERAATQTPGQNLHATLALDQPQGFFRLLSIPAGGIAKLGSGGAEVFGYGEALAQELRRIGQISPDQFAAMFPNGATCLPGISWDPTTGQFWDGFNANPD